MGKTSIALVGLLFLAIGGMAQPIPAPATTSQATNLVAQDSYMSPARVGDFWYDVGIPFVLSNGGGTIASNSIAKNNGVGTNLTIYGTLTSTNFDSKIISASNGVLGTASNVFSIKGSAGGVVPAPATTSQATNLVVQDSYMSPARVGDFWNDVVIPYILTFVSGGSVTFVPGTVTNSGVIYVAGILTNQATFIGTSVPVINTGGSTNTIANNNGFGTNLTVYGTLTSTNLNAAIQSATNNLLTTVSNQFYGIGNSSNFQTWLQVSNTVQAATNGFTSGSLNSISNNNGSGTNLTVYGTLTSTNITAAIQSATNNFGNTIAVTMTNANNVFYGNGSNLTGISSGATNAIANLNGFGTNTTILTTNNAPTYSTNYSYSTNFTYSTNYAVTGTTFASGANGTYKQTTNYGGVPAFTNNAGFYLFFYSGYNANYIATSLGTPVNAWQETDYPFNLDYSGSYAPIGSYTGTGIVTGSITTNYISTNSVITTNITFTTNFSPTNGGTFIGMFAGNGSGLTNLQSTNIVGLVAGSGIAISNGFGTNLTVYGTLTSTNITAAIQSATNNLLTTVSNKFYGIGNSSNFQTWLQVSNTVQAATNGFTSGSLNSISNNNGFGTNLTVYGTLTSTNITAAIQSATNNFGNTVAVNMTNAANQFAGSGGGLTNLNYNNITNLPVIPSTNGFVTASITNGLATTNYVNAITNGLATTNYVNAITNGLATTDYVNTATNNFGNSVAVNMTNAANQFTGTFNGNSTTASSGWPTQWPQASITNANWATNTPAGIAAAGGLTNNETGVTLNGTISGTFGTLTASNSITVNTNIILAGGASAGSYFFGSPFTNAFNGSYVSTVYSYVTLTSYTNGPYTGINYISTFNYNTNGVNAFVSSNWFYGWPPPYGQSLSNTAYTYYQPVTNYSTVGNGSGLTNIPPTALSVGATFNNVDIPTNTLGTHGYSGYFTNGVFVSTGTY